MFRFWADGLPNVSKTVLGGAASEGPSGHSDIVAVNGTPCAIYLTQEKVAATATQSAAEIVNV